MHAHTHAHAHMHTYLCELVLNLLLVLESQKLKAFNVSGACGQVAVLEEASKVKVVWLHAVKLQTSKCAHTRTHTQKNSTTQK